MKKLVTFVVVLVMVGTAQVASATSFSDEVNALLPVGYWQFENTSWSDSSGNGNTLTAWNGPGVTPGPGLPGLPGNAADFRYAGGQKALWVDTTTPSGSVLNISSGTTWAVNAWVSNDQFDLWNTVVVNRDGVDSGAGGYNYGLATYAASTNTNYLRAMSPWTLDASGTFTSAPGAWHMLSISVDMAATASPYKYSWYVDGVLVSTADQSATTLSSDGVSLEIGNTYHGQDGNYNKFLGRIDELAIFNHTLSASEIAGLYTAATTPEPATLGILALGSLLVARRRSKI